MRASVGPGVRLVVETLGTRVLLVGLAFVTSVVVSRALGPEGRGLYATAVTLGMLAVEFGHLGLGDATVYTAARDPASAPSLLGNVLPAGLGVGVAVAATVWLLGVLAPSLLPLPGPLLLLGLAWIPVGLTARLAQSLLAGLLQQRTCNALDVTGRSTVLVASVGLTLAGVASAATVTGAWLLGTATVAILALARLRVWLGTAGRPSLPWLRSCLAYGIRTYWPSAFGVTIARADLLLVAGLLGAEAAGLYAVAVSMTDVLAILPYVTGAVLFPRLVAAPDAAGRWHLTRRAALGVGLTMTGLLALAFLVAGPLVRLVFGPAFAGAVPAFHWRTPGVLGMALHTVFLTHVKASGMPAGLAWASGLVAAAGIVLAVLLVWRLGLAGAALAASVSWLLMLAASAGWALQPERDPA